MNRFETIARIYFMRHCFDFPDLFLSYHFNVLATYTLNEMRSDGTLSFPGSELKRRRMLSTIFLCLKGLYGQGRHAYVCSMIYQVLHDKLYQRERDLLMSELGLGDWPGENRSAGGASMVKRCRSVFPMPAAKRGEDPTKHTLEQLVKGYSRMNINDILNPDDEDGSVVDQETPE